MRYFEPRICARRGVSAAKQLRSRPDRRTARLAKPHAKQPPNSTETPRRRSHTPRSRQENNSVQPPKSARAERASDARSSVLVVHASRSVCANHSRARTQAAEAPPSNQPSSAARWQARFYTTRPHVPIPKPCKLRLAKSARTLDAHPSRNLTATTRNRPNPLMRALPCWSLNRRAPCARITREPARKLPRRHARTNVPSAESLESARAYDLPRARGFRTQTPKAECEYAGPCDHQQK